MRDRNRPMPDLEDAHGFFKTCGKWLQPIMTGMGSRANRPWRQRLFRGFSNEFQYLCVFGGYGYLTLVPLGIKG